MQACSSSNGQLYTWNAALADFVGAGYTGPGVPQDIAIAQRPPATIGATGPAGTLATIGRLTTLHSPLALWSFNGVLTDASGNGRTLTVAAGAAVYAELWPGYKGIDFNGTLRLGQTASAFNVLGDITIEMVIVLNATPNGNAFLVWGGPGETEAENASFQVTINADRSVTIISEHGAGVNDTFTTAAVAVPPPGIPFHFCVRRASNVWQVLVNGVVLGAASSALTAPTGGSTGALIVGANLVPALAAAMLIADLKIIGSALTTPQVLAEAELTVGQLY